MRKPLDYIFLYLKGLCIGATGFFQGISGGSFALLLGIYQELIFSLRAIDENAFQLLKEKRFQDFWLKINGNFLITLLAGVITGLWTLRPLLGRLYNQYFILISSFFFSLVIIAALLLLRRIIRWNVTVAICLFAGTGLSYLLTLLPLLTVPDNLFFSLLVGLLACCTFVIPGVSGSFILLIFGKYQYILASFDTLDIIVIAFFILGGILGISVMTRYIGSMLADSFDATVALLAGLMIGSLNKIWPWREVYEYATTFHGEQMPAFDKSILPWQYMELTGKDPQVFYAVLMMALGVFIVVLLEKIAARLKTKS